MSTRKITTRGTNPYLIAPILCREHGAVGNNAENKTPQQWEKREQTWKLFIYDLSYNLRQNLEKILTRLIMLLPVQNDKVELDVLDKQQKTMFTELQEAYQILDEQMRRIANLQHHWAEAFPQFAYVFQNWILRNWAPDFQQCMENASKMCSLSEDQMFGKQKNECRKMIHEIHDFLCVKLPPQLIMDNLFRKPELQKNVQWWEKEYIDKETNWQFNRLRQYEQWRQQFEEFVDP